VFYKKAGGIIVFFKDNVYNKLPKKFNGR